MATLKPTVIAALVAAVARRVGSPAQLGRAAASAAPGPVVPRVVPLFPPLPDATDSLESTGRRCERGGGVTLPPEALVGLLGH